MTECVFCAKRSPGKYAVYPDKMCPAHLESTGLGAYIAKHPTGYCDDACGCEFVTLEELDRLLAEKEAPAAQAGAATDEEG